MRLGDRRNGRHLGYNSNRLGDRKRFNNSPHLQTVGGESSVDRFSSQLPLCLNGYALGDFDMSSALVGPLIEFNTEHTLFIGCFCTVGVDFVTQRNGA